MIEDIEFVSIEIDGVKHKFGFNGFACTWTRCAQFVELDKTVYSPQRVTCLLCLGAQ